ncbi:hypothetical protein ACFU99_25860 [Streptomyces sp. NPDC057654]|uniref:hypothetical protein n=1 Tax=Streptomyces sp. NPDC057654 TaxID=3346196 RepID=UPI0036CEC831
MGTQVPREHTDSARTQGAPEWQTPDVDGRADVVDEDHAIASSIGAEPSMYFPERDGKAVPEDGTWIIVVEDHSPNCVPAFGCRR